MFQKILVANDGSRGAQQALQVGIDFAKRYEAELHTISVAEPLVQHIAKVVGGDLRTDTEAREYFRLLTIRAGLLAEASGVRLKAHVLAGHEVETIATFLEVHRFDLLVVGFLGHSKILGQNWGSTSYNLTSLAPCTVLVVK